jgi:hypothetical protein
MKKPTKSIPYEDPADPMRDLDVELESQDDEIIDLEDIIEMPARPIDEDEDLDLDVEILDVDADLEPEPERPARKAPQPAMRERGPQPILEDEDLINSFGEESEEDEELFGTVASGAGPAKKTAGRAELDVFEEKDEKAILDELLDEIEMPESSAGGGTGASLRERAASAIKVPEETRSVEIESEPAVSGSPGSGRTPIQPSVDLSRTVEELVDQIESRLQEHIRVVVESRLPNLVRSIIDEELQKLRKELQ